MATGRELVSAVRSMHKMLSTDNLINDRVILYEIKNNMLLLVKRETNLRKLWSTDTIFTTIPCLDMKEVSVSECSGYTDPCTIARSVNKIPRISEGNYQYLIQGVYSINVLSGKGKRLKEISVNRYLNLLKLPFVRKEEYFWITDDYLYVTNPLISKVRLVALFEEDIPSELLFYECGCATPQYTNDEICMNPLDREFPLPGYLRKQVLDLTSAKLLQSYFRMREDTSQEGVDTQTANLPTTRRGRDYENEG